MIILRLIVTLKRDDRYTEKNLAEFSCKIWITNIFCSNSYIFCSESYSLAVVAKPFVLAAKNVTLVAKNVNYPYITTKFSYGS